MVGVDPNTCIHRYLKMITFIIDSFTLISKQTYVKRREKTEKEESPKTNPDSRANRTPDAKPATSLRA